MFKKLKKIHDTFLITDLNNLLLIFTLLIFLVSLIFLKNIYLYFLIYLFLFDLANNIKNKYLLYFNYLLAIFLISFFFFNMSFFGVNINNIFAIILKIFFYLDYFLIIFLTIKKKKYRFLKSSKRNTKKYTFKDLRERKIEKFKKINQEVITNYLKKHDISDNSDYFKVINDNYLNKTKNDLEEYVWLNYLRFYKNKKYQKVGLDKKNFLFLSIHAIILVLVFLVR